MLAATDRARHMRELEHCQQVYRADGWQAALAPRPRNLGINPADQEIEPGGQPIPISAERAANFSYFIEHDFTAVREDRLDALPLQQTAVQIMPAWGRHTPPQVFDRQCAAELGKLLNVPIAEFPGGHNGNLTHPTAYAEQVRTLIATGRP